MTAYEQLLKVYSNPSPLEGSEAETQFKLLKAEKQKLDSLLTIENKALFTALQSLVDLFKKKLDKLAIPESEGIQINAINKSAMTPLPNMGLSGISNNSAAMIIQANDAERVNYV